jgi:hypothetical protein
MEWQGFIMIGVNGVGVKIGGFENKIGKACVICQVMYCKFFSEHDRRHRESGVKS